MILLILRFLLLIWPARTEIAESANTALPGCSDSCGGVAIPYPFGIGPNCSMSEVFEVSCNTINRSSTPYWGDFVVLDINLSLGQVRTSIPISYQCYNSKTKEVEDSDWWLSVDPPFRYDHERNKFVVIGCDTLAFVNFINDQNSYLGGCVSGCGSLESLTDGSCSGIGCCETSIPAGTNNITFWFDDKYNNSDVYSFSPCSYAMLVEEGGFHFNTGYITTSQLKDQNVSVVIDWVVGNTTCNAARTSKSYACKSKYSNCSDSNSGPGYVCNCSDGYQGNPYLQGGCICLSLSLLLALSL
ncbi:Wall-associated receptor kinase 2 [Rhynchospora pubera]|uniref:Wall-associated receptor kinase 2 n=1 Tax=Rhynchospora pubera TaxID=906938 RepID=A0AAV8BVA5_9POAL|nr:Wall-associated receptor kinase 2 [Rhynchospora pubera]KAJ4801195.1 Wall-associated receptor kinase 2 [Rhynchospora pubera]